ncbi:MAG TPA: hypothetical protein VHO48_15125 [Anaerolineaceae bacterium]|nr:hypothetical protein [Anaerolineaceae bacterium]
MPRFLSWTKIVLRTVLLFIFAASILAMSAPLLSDPIEKVRAYTRDIEFDYASWMANALWVKWSNAVFGAERYLQPTIEHDLVVEYMGLVQEQNNTLAQVTRIYADPDVADPKTSSAILRQELARINTRLDQVGSLAESILQEQVTSVISADGLALGGQPVPPVWYHTTDLPLALIVSPRSVIRQDANISLLPEMNIEQIVALEEEVSKGLDVSALVTPVGGIGVYPTMITTTSNLDWLSEVIAHEWIHNYLTLRPLGMSFDKNEQLRTMNETTANLAGKEIGRQVLERYYPELLPAPVIEASAQTNSTEETTEAAPEFNFNQEMHGIRVKVDALLAAGKIEEAEKLMDNSRRVFLEHGYVIRELNQAYFAFHGAYADSPAGAAGEDPVGPAVRQLRDQSTSLADFLQRIGRMTTFEELQQAVE